MIPPIFYPTKQDYLYPDTPITDPKGQSAYLPIEIDTEYFHLDYDINHAGQYKRVQKTLTNQLRAIAVDKAAIFAHPDINDIARHPSLALASPSSITSRRWGIMLASDVSTLPLAERSIPR
jgi:hypothetical protein